MTANLNARYNAHRTGRGAEWTKLHAPIRIQTTFEADTEEEAKKKEAFHTSKLILKHGVNKVRGGALTLAKRPYDTRERDVRLIAGVMRKALEPDMDYSEAREFVFLDLDNEKQSPASHEEFEGEGMISALLSGLSIGSSQGAGSSRSGGPSTRTRSSASGSGGNGCGRCGRNSHSRGGCYAKTHLEGWYIWDSGCERCGRRSHKRERCYARTDIDGDAIPA